MASNTPAVESDEALMVRVQAGNTDAFGILFDRHYVRALSIAQSVCNDHTRAEDAVQEGFLALWHSRSRFDCERGHFRPWAMTLIRYRAIDSVRSETARQPPTTSSGGVETREQVSEHDSVASEAIAHSAATTLRASLAQLPPAQAEVIVLAFYGGLSHSEIADQLDLPDGTVKGRMRLGLAKLRAASDLAS